MKRLLTFRLSYLLSLLGQIGVYSIFLCNCDNVNNILHPSSETNKRDKASHIGSGGPPTIDLSTTEAYINLGNKESFHISGACTPEGVLISLSGAATAETQCLNEAFSSLVNYEDVPDGEVQIIAALKNTNTNNAIQATKTVIKDTILPKVDLSNTPISMNNSNVSQFFVSGTCSEENKTIEISGVLSGSAECKDNIFSVSLNYANISDGEVIIVADLKDDAKNSADQIFLTVIKDTLAPSVTLSPSLLNYINQANQTAFTVNGTCSENNGTVIVSGEVSGAAKCMDRNFSLDLDYSDVVDGNVTINADMTDDAGNVAARATKVLIKDVTQPIISLSSTGTQVNDANKSAFVISGTCSDEGLYVAISGAITGNIQCISGIFSAPFDLSNVAEGNIWLYADLNDDAGNFAAQASKSLSVTFNDAPVIVAESIHGLINTPVTLAFQVDEGGGTDEDVQAILMFASSSNETLIQNTNIVINYSDDGASDATGGSLGLTPESNAIGFTKIILTADDQMSTNHLSTQEIFYTVYQNQFSNVYTIPWNSNISANTNLTVRYTSTMTLPSDGKIFLTFSSDVNVAGLTLEQKSGIDGGVTLSYDASQNTITLTRDGTGLDSAAGAKYLIFSGLTNPSKVGRFAAIFYHSNASNTIVEGPFASNFSVTPLNDGLDSSSPWPKYKADYADTSRGKTAGPEYPAIAWTFASGYGDSHSSAVQDNEGNLYFGGNAFNSITSTGELRWTIPKGTNVYYPALSENGTVYFLDGSNIYAVSKDSGAVLWSYNISDSQNYNNGVVLGIDGTVYIFGRYGTNYALNSDGTLKWKFADGNLNVRMAPTFAINPANGNMTSCGETGFRRTTPDGLLIDNLNSDPTLKGIANTSNFVNDAPSVAADNSAYVSGRYAANGIFSMTANAGQKWLNGSSIGGGQSVGGLSSDDSLFFTQSTGNIYAINTSDGTINWGPIVTSGATWTADLAVDPFNNLIFYGNYAINQTNGALKWKYDALGNCDRATIGKNGFLYCLQHYSAANSVFAIKPWTLSSASNQGSYHAGNTMTITAKSSMLRRDPSSGGLDNQAQAIMPNGDKVVLTYQGLDSDKTIWSGTYVIPSDTPLGNYSARIEAQQFHVETDIPTTFPSPLTGSNNSGIFGTLNFVVN